MANNVEIKVSADTAQAVAGLNAVGKELQTTGSQAQQLTGKAAPAGQSLQAVGAGADTASTGLGKTRTGLQSISEQLSVARTQLVSFLTAQLGLGAGKEVIQTADAYNNLQARIKLATGEGALFTTTFDNIAEIALRTNSSLEQTGTLFTRLAESGKSAGLTTETATAQALRLTETINQAVQLSGGSAQSASAAVTQLIQGLQSGVLRGEEFNSVLEQAPRLAKALSDGLGVTTGELRKLAEAGSLSADVVINALKGQADTLKSEFATLPPTVGRALENLTTSWTLYIGQADAATGASAGAASAINALAKNLETVAGFLIDAGQAAAGFFALRLTQRFTEIGAATAQATVATTANTVAVRANTVAAAQSDVAFKLLSADVARQTALLAGNTTAVAANTTATTAQGAAATQAAASVGRFAAILSTLRTFALIGLVTNFKDIGTAIGEGIARLAGFKDRTDELARAEKNAALIAAENIALRERGQALTQAAIDKQFELSKAATLAIGEFEKLTREGNTAAEAVVKIGKDFDLASVPGIRNATAVLDKLAADGKLSASQFQTAWADALKGADLGVFEAQARAAFSGTAREAERLAQVIDVSLREAVKRTGLDFDVLAGGIGKASRGAINDTDAIISGLVRLKAQGVDTGLALTASLSKSINTADSQKALDAIRLQIESVRKELGTTVTNGLLDQAAQKALELGDALNKAKPGINGLREAMQELGLRSREELQATAQRATQAYDLIKAKGAEEGESFIAYQARKSDAAKVYLERLIAANGGVASEAIKTRAAVEGVTIAVDDNGRATVSSGAKGTQAFKDIGSAASQAGQAIGGINPVLQAANAAYQQLIDTATKATAATQAYDKARSNAAARELTDRANAREGVDASGNRLGAGTDLGSRTGIVNFLKNAGVNDEAAARRIANEFANTKGEVEYFNNPGQIKYGGRNGTLSEALLKAAEQFTFGQNAPRVGGTAPAPGTPPAPAPATQNTYVVRLDLGAGQSREVNVASANDAQALIGALQVARRQAGG